MIYDVTVDGTAHRLELERDEGNWKSFSMAGRSPWTPSCCAPTCFCRLMADTYEIKRERTAD